MRNYSVKTRKQAIVLLVLGAAGLGCGNAAVLIREDATSAGGGGGMGGAGGMAGAGGGCEGQCAPLGPVEWLGPALLWIGKEGEAPECPPSAPVEGSPMYADLDAPNVCGACKCDAPSGSCALPTGLTAAAASCSGDGSGVAHTSFDAPAAWDGSCNTASPIAANVKCNGINCVQSLTIDPLTLTETACGVTMEPVAAKLPSTWGTVARSCRGIAYGPCSSPAEICSPAAEPGFAQCLFRNGDNECPDTYSVRHLLYQGFEDTRACTSCACSAPLGGTCAALVLAYQDGACSTQVGSTVVSAVKSSCVDLLPGSALGSKLAEAPVYAPGVCQVSGGETTGAAVPEGPSTFCCLP